ncbi:carbohydrate ABC transporter permease [Breznakiella homolactica]|uniref:Maltose/maltodextrin transport system permease protein MalG n=1 Tax=Breznakiella homolactica TaxID=2798577 RepID=A0A7T7XMS7_9SPIR|nr:carbohydrate ABC transporter permease [Breznakiella homolactica]QQO09176.1 carbohydrate ABC transporter permease [Breznakiella homolactica]
MKNPLSSKIFRTELILNLAAIALVVIFLFPVYWMFITSLKSNSEIFARTPTFFPKKIVFDGYIRQLGYSAVPIWVNFRNSFAIAFCTTAVSTVLATFSAYGLARYRLKLAKPIMMCFLISEMLPTVLFLAPLFITFNKIKIMDTLLAPVIFSCLHGIPFSVITLRPYFLGIPKELEDSAIIDGCNRFTAFIRIMVPIAVPGIVIAGAFTFIWGWGDLMGALTFIRTDMLQPLTVNMYKAIGEFGVEWSSLMAFAVIITVPVLLMFIFLQRYLVNGMTAGAVKG